MNEIINVNLYGDGSRESKLRAEAIYCDKHEHCSLYKRGCCCKITSGFSPRCPFGLVHAYGYHSKNTKSYNKLYSETRSDPNYHVLTYPSDFTLEAAGDYALLNLKYIVCKWDCNTSTLHINSSPVFPEITAVPIYALTPDNIKKICDAKPRTAFGNELIMSYEKQVLPDLIASLRKNLFDVYSEFVAEFPDLDFKPNYVGKKAKLISLNKEIDYKDPIYGSPFRFESEGSELYLVFKNYHSAFLPFGAKEAFIKVKCTEDMTMKVTDNSQVLEDSTIFC